MISHNLRWKKATYRWNHYGLLPRITAILLVSSSLYSAAIWFLPYVFPFVFFGVGGAFSTVLLGFAWFKVVPYMRKMDYLHEKELVRIEAKHWLEGK